MATKRIVRHRCCKCVHCANTRGDRCLREGYSRHITRALNQQRPRWRTHTRMSLLILVALLLVSINATPCAVQLCILNASTYNTTLEAVKQIFDGLPIQYEIVPCETTTASCLVFTDTPRGNRTKERPYACTHHNEINVQHEHGLLESTVVHSFSFIATPIDDLCFAMNRTWCDIQQIYMYTHCKDLSYAYEYQFGFWYACMAASIFTTIPVIWSYHYLFYLETV